MNFKKIIPKKLLYLWRFLMNKKDRQVIIDFLYSKKNKLFFIKKLKLIEKLYQISNEVESPHYQHEILAFFNKVLTLDKPGCLVEAGTFKGSSTAKFSLLAKITNRKLFVFDSFEGLPENSEEHGKNIFGKKVIFPKGKYKGTLKEVKENVKKFGDLKSCCFVKGWFENTMPTFKEKVASAYLDVDLVSSTETCLKYLYPLLIPGGSIFSQDGHLPLIIKKLKSKKFWLNKIKSEKPKIKNLGKEKLIEVLKS